MELYLASKSVPRADLLRELGISFVIAPAEIDESRAIAQYGDPVRIVSELARQKAEAVVSSLKGLPAIVVGCDTVNRRGGRILSKPKDAEEAKRMLEMLSAYSDEQYTGICVFDPAEKYPFSQVGRARYTFSGFRDTDIDDYIRSGEPLNFAGALNPRGRFAKTFGIAKNAYYHSEYSFPLEFLLDVLRKYDLLPDFSRA